MNKYYTYPNIDLWDDKTWKDKDAPIESLVEKILSKSYETVYKEYSKGIYKNRELTEINQKANACIFDDVIEEYKNMEFHLTAMGFVSWMALVPKDVNPKTKLLVIFACADLSDPLWAMDLLNYYKEDAQSANDNHYAVLWIVYKNNVSSGIYMDIMLEVSAFWRLDMKEVYLDVSLLKNIENTSFIDSILFKKKVMKITDLWQAKIAHQYICLSLNKKNKEFDYERLIHSTLGRRISDSMMLEKKYNRWNDRGLIEELNEKGLAIEEHYTSGERWLTVSPNQQDKKIPLLICMKEVRPSSEFQAVTALQFYYDYLDIVGNGECMMLFFALESVEDNELLTTIIKEAEEIYPIDKERIYITGQSHNGYFALEYARRHHDIITAVATLNDRHGFSSPRYSVDNVIITDKMIDDFESFDLPLINICGEIENVFPHTIKGSVAYYNQINALHRRLKAFRIPDYSDKEIEDALESSDIVARKNGLPSTRTEVDYIMGFNVYISDFKNIDGDYHLRLVTLENLPHMITPQMVVLSWSFLRNFKKDKNGKVVEISKEKEE